YTLRVNYRTSHQIRKRADRLLPALLTDVDGNEESRSATVSLFNGDPPVVQILKSQADESQTIAEWLKSLITDGYLPHEIGVFTRTTGELARAGRAIEQAGLKAIELTDSINQRTGHVAIGTMHLAKGLEFKAVAVMACDEDVLPLQERIETVGDLADLEDLYNTERNLLYVACTRARNRLLVTGVEPGSEFLDDLGVDRI
nr:ATP-binding domain-containing protein [bacterium]